MVQWEQIRHQVAIAGRITDAQTGKPLGGVRVSLAGTVTATLTAPDGHFHFLDLADGSYTLAAALSPKDTRYGAAQLAVTVARDAHGRLLVATADISLPSTALAGQITDQNNAPIWMAQVRVSGSKDLSFSDSQGKYLLSALETGTRTIQAAAQGYQTGLQSIQITNPGSVQTLDFKLLPNP